MDDVRDTPPRCWRPRWWQRTVDLVALMVGLLVWLGLSLLTAGLFAAVCRGGHADG